MKLELHPPSWSAAALTRPDVRTLLDTAEALRRAGTGHPPLHGKHLALVCQSPPPQLATLLHAAAAALGASLSDVEPGVLRLDDPQQGPPAARMLGRLYDAIVLDSEDAASLHRLALQAARPVLGLSQRPTSPLHLLAELLAMQQAAGRPARPLRLCVADDAASPWALAWAQLATLTALEVCCQRPAGRQARFGADIQMVDFIIEPASPPAADGRPLLHAAADSAPLTGTTQHLQRLLQAMLLLALR